MLDSLFSSTASVLIYCQCHHVQSCTKHVEIMYLIESTVQSTVRGFYWFYYPRSNQSNVTGFVKRDHIPQKSEIELATPLYCT